MALNVITAIGVIAALVEVGFLIYKNSSDHETNRMRDTIRIYNQIYKKTSELKSDFVRVTESNKFTLESIKQSDELSNLVMDYLTEIESFAVGVRLKVFTCDVFVKLTSEDLCNCLSELVDYIEFKRIESKYSKLFDESMAFINYIRYIQGCKKQGTEISRNITNFHSGRAHTAY